MILILEGPSWIALTSVGAEATACIDQVLIDSYYIQVRETDNGFDKLLQFGLA